MKRILFLCPHNAAKSVLAAAYFNKRVTYLGVEARAFSAGTEPDDAVSAHVATLLDERGYGRSEHKPRRVKRADFEEADQIISIGCDLRDLPETDKKIARWDDVAPPSRNLEGAWQQVRARVDKLIGELNG